MTLQDWLNKNGKIAADLGGEEKAVTVLSDDRDLRHLTDYYVSSVTAGAVILKPKAAPAPYCLPRCAGMTSTRAEVCKYIRRVIDDLEWLNSGNVEGRVLNDIQNFRSALWNGLTAEGWTLSYDGGNRLKVRPPADHRSGAD